LSLAKTSSETTAHPGDTITYTLHYTNPSGITVNNVVITDTLPPSGAMTYVAGTASGNGVYNSAANTLTWTVASVPPFASVALTYQMQVGPLGGMYNPVVNNAQITFTGGGSGATASSAVSVVGSYVIHIGIYNEAGELIKTLGLFETSAGIAGFSVEGSLTSSQSAVTFVYDGEVIGTWNATNSSGGTVSNGTYIVKVDSTDPFGVTTTVTHNVTVSIATSTLQIAVYNSAGEVVKTFTQQQIQTLVAGANGALTPADYNVAEAGISSGLLIPSYTNSGGPGSTVTVTLGSGRGFTWNGTGNNGQILASGHYFIQMTSFTPGGPQQQTIMGITIQDNNNNAINGVVLAPNPVNLSQTTQATFLINTGLTQVDSVKVKIYTVAGELVRTLTSLPGTPTQVVWDFTQFQPASGTYICVVELNANGGLVGRHITRAVIIR
jgi:uncharacterized repeat protein (TIGR01451 family)